MLKGTSRTIWLLVAIAVGGCSDDGDEGAPPPREEGAAVSTAERELRAARALEAATLDAGRHADSAEQILRSVRFLTGSEQGTLRRDVNRVQVARARSLGVRAGRGEEIERLVREGRLVALEDTTPYWVVEELTQSVAYVTPDTRRMLLELGSRFHERLDSLGSPRFRMLVTSVMRTSETQEELRRINANASSTASAHEFGTTVDISHLRFAGPGDPVPRRPDSPVGQDGFRDVYAVAMDSAAVRSASALRAVLGRVLQEMRAEGKLMVMMERQQAVFHATVARRFPEAR